MKLNFRIKTLTPIWTGNVERECNVLRETSLIGSLRWWFEVIVRGFGCYACDSVGEATKRCELDYKSFKSGVDPKDLICPVCYVFGTTGWSRRFRVEVSNYNKTTVQIATKKLGCAQSKDVSWWIRNTVGLNCSVLSGNNICVEIILLNKDISSNILYLILKTIEKMGAIGSHNSYGFGIIKADLPSGLNIKRAFDFIESYPKKWYNEKLFKRVKDLPSFKNMFKIDFELLEDINYKNKNFGFVLKYTLRQAFKNDGKFRSYVEKLFGSKKGSPNKFAGRIFVSNCWKEDNGWYFRIYGFLYGFDEVEEIISKINETVKDCLKKVDIKEKIVIKNLDDFKREVGDGND